MGSKVPTSQELFLLVTLLFLFQKKRKKKLDSNLWIRFPLINFGKNKLIKRAILTCVMPNSEVKFFNMNFTK